jgi:hypothetical protein
MTHTSKFVLQTHRLILVLWLLLAGLGTSVALAQTVIRQRDVPIVIKHPGSYVLGSNLVVKNPNVNAILVDTDNVTIDLNGFAIIGPNVGATGKGSGIVTTSSRKNVVARNGSVRGFFDAAQACVSLDGENGKAEDLRVQDCPQIGIFVSHGGIVSGCQVSNSGSGIHTYGGALVTNNTLFNNSWAGLGLNYGGSTVIWNTFRDNGVAIAVNGGDAVICPIEEQGQCGKGNRIEGNTLTKNGVGIDLPGSDNFFARNFLKANGTPIVGAEDDIDGGTIDPALKNVVIP